MHYIDGLLTELTGVKQIYKHQNYYWYMRDATSGTRLNHRIIHNTGVWLISIRVLEFSHKEDGKLVN